MHCNDLNWDLGVRSWNNSLVVNVTETYVHHTYVLCAATIVKNGGKGSLPIHISYRWSGIREDLRLNWNLEFELSLVNFDTI